MTFPAEVAEVTLTPTPLMFQNFSTRIHKFFKFENPTPVASEISDFTPLTHAQSNLLHT